MLKEGWKSTTVDLSIILLHYQPKEQVRHMPLPTVITAQSLRMEVAVQVSIIGIDCVRRDPPVDASRKGKTHLSPAKIVPYFKPSYVGLIFYLNVIKDADIVPSVF